MTRRRWIALVLAGCGFLFGLAAGAVWFVSDAHGHGLASPDRRAIWMLSIGALACFVSAGVLLARRRREGGQAR